MTNNQTTFSKQELYEFLLNFFADSKHSDIEDIWKYTCDIFSIQDCNNIQAIERDAQKKYNEIEDFHYQIPLWTFSNITNSERLHVVQGVLLFCSQHSDKDIMAEKDFQNEFDVEYETWKAEAKYALQRLNTQQ